MRSLVPGCFRFLGKLLARAHKASANRPIEFLTLSTSQPIATKKDSLVYAARAQCGATACGGEIKSYAAADAARWDAFVEDAAAASFCHLSGWLRVVERTWRHQNHSLYAECEGRITGVLPLFLVGINLPGRFLRSVSGFGPRLVSTPNAVYGGAIAIDAATQRALIQAAQQLAWNLAVDYLELRETPCNDSAGNGSADDNTDGQFHTQELYVSFDHPLTPDEDELLASFPRDVRRMIRQGGKHELTAEVGGAELLDEFYEVYAVSVRNLGTPVFPRRLLAEFLREFPDACDILVVRQGQRVAGAVLSFYFRETVMPYYGGAYPEFYAAGINNFMYWELMRRAAARGYTRFDFGRSKRGTGAYAFKRGWRMTEHALPYKFHLVRARQMPNLNPSNPRFKPVIELWKRLPLGLTKRIGPLIVRNIP